MKYTVDIEKKTITHSGLHKNYLEALRKVYGGKYSFIEDHPQVLPVAELKEELHSRDIMEHWRSYQKSGMLIQDASLGMTTTPYLIADRTVLNHSNENEVKIKELEDKLQELKAASDFHTHEITRMEGLVQIRFDQQTKGLEELKQQFKT